MPTVGFLHTEPTHVALVARLVREHAPGMVDVHLVDTGLLDHLRRLRDQGFDGLDEDLSRRLGARIGELVGRAVDAVVCTCVALGDEAVRLTPAGDVPVFGPGLLEGRALTRL